VFGYNDPEKAGSNEPAFFVFGWWVFSKMILIFENQKARFLIFAKK